MKQNDLIFLHGGTGMDFSYFSPFCEKIVGKHHYYTQGETTQDYTISGLIDELKNIFDENSIERGVLVGHSFGGALALEFFNIFPEKVKALILVTPIYSYEWSKIYKENTDKDESIYINDSNLSNDKNYQNLSLFYKDKYFTSDFRGIGVKTLKDIKYNAKLRQDILKNYLSDFDCSNIVEKLNIPVLVISGDEDKVVYPEHIENLIKLNSRIEHHCFMNSAHFPFIDENNLFINTANKFIGGLK